METAGGAASQGHGKSRRILASEASGQHSRLQHSLAETLACPSTGEPGSAIPEMVVRHRQRSSWLSLATRSKASLMLLIRYWYSSPSDGSSLTIRYVLSAAI